MLHKYHRVRNQIFVKWLRDAFPNGRYFLNPRLGQVLWEFTPTTRFGRTKGKLINCEARADAVVIHNNKVYIIERLTRPESWKIEKLEEYERLFRKTLRFKDYWNYPIEKILCTLIHHPLIEIKARGKGIKVI
jgi:hypothetical protein